MARPLRLEFPGALYQVTARGNKRRAIVRDDEDRKTFLAILTRTVRLFRWTLHAYVLLGNHYHLLVETPEPNLARGMRQLNGLYGQTFNRRHGRGGQARTLVAWLGRTEGALRLREIAEALGIDIARVSRLVAEGEEHMRKTTEFRTKAERAVQLLSDKSNV